MIEDDKCYGVGAGTTAGKSRGNAGARGRVVLSIGWVWGVP